MKYQFIHDHQQTFRLRSLCRAFHVSRGGYYAWVRRPESPRTQANRRLLDQIRRVHAQHRKTCGSDKTWRLLRAPGETCGRHRVARLRRQNGVEAIRMRRFKASYAARNSVPPAFNLLDRNFTADRPNRVWAGDVTFIPTRQGWLHLAVLLDLYSRSVVGWAMGTKQNRQLVCDALAMALEQRRPAPGLIHHSDQGIVYQSARYQTLLRSHHLMASMSRKGNCYDNAVVESFFSHLKNDLIHHKTFPTRDEAKAALFDYIECFYNRQRIHQTLNYRTPAEYEKLRCVA